MTEEEIELNPKMNTNCLEILKLRGDAVSLYAVKWIQELQKNITT